MAKLPKYLKLEPISATQYKLVIKKWGIPILVYKCLKENFELKWYQWLFYPYLCFKIMRSAADG